MLTDAALARRLTEQAKTYLTQVDGEIDEATWAALRAGVVLKDARTLPPQAS